MKGGVDFPTEDDMIAAEALLDLKSSEVSSFIELLADSSWKRKRRRSCLDSALPIQMPLNVIKPTKDGGSPTSPDSPFVFPADDKKNTSTSTKRSKKNNYLVDVIEELTQENGLLRGEIGNVKKHCSKLKAYNSQLKTIKLKVVSGLKNVGITDPTAAQEIQFQVGPVTAHSHQSNNGLASVNHVGPIGFDLNVVPAEDTMDIEGMMIADQRARYAEARKMRRRIINTKSMRSSKNRV